MTSAADFMGGPMHGKVMAFQEEEPPLVLHVQTPLGRPVVEGPDGEVIIELTQLHYERTVSTLDDGPLWTYILKPNEEGAS